MTLPSRFYPVMPDASWVRRVVEAGARFVQLRCKGQPLAEVERQVKASLEVCEAHGASLVVNDYGAIAIDQGAPWLHLGQEDLAAADLTTIRASGIRLGVSTHDAAELSTALAAEPDYVALGPIWATKLKKMKWAPQGLDKLRRWVEGAGRPVVGIGGITPPRATEVLATGAASAAVVTDIVLAADPEAKVAAFLEACGELP